LVWGGGKDVNENVIANVNLIVDSQRFALPPYHAPHLSWVKTYFTADLADESSSASKPALGPPPGPPGAVVGETGTSSRTASSADSLWAPSRLTSSADNACVSWRCDTKYAGFSSIFFAPR